MSMSRLWRFRAGHGYEARSQHVAGPVLAVSIVWNRVAGHELQLGAGGGDCQCEGYREAVGHFEGGGD